MEHALRAAMRAAIREIPDYPNPGILFKDITPLLADPALFGAACVLLAAPFEAAGITHIVAIESRGFLFGGPVAVALGAGLVPVRKPGKLPFRTSRLEYALEYGSDAVEIHDDALDASSRVVIVDDVLATGGTAAAAAALVRRLGANVIGSTFLIELEFLRGRERLTEQRVESIVGYQ
jgi:adenine phosphoribosyltransferase